MQKREGGREVRSRLAGKNRIWNTASGVASSEERSNGGVGGGELNWYRNAWMGGGGGGEIDLAG